MDPQEPPFQLYMFPDVQKQAEFPVLNGFYDIFYFETRMRQLVEDAIQPIYKDANKQLERIMHNKNALKGICDRIHTLEQFMNSYGTQQEDKEF